MLNVKLELVKKGMSMKAYGKYIGVSERTVQNKLSGASDFTYPEIKKTQELFPNLSMDYLFRDNENLNNQGSAQEEK